MCHGTQYFQTSSVIIIINWHVTTEGAIIDQILTMLQKHWKACCYIETEHIYTSKACPVRVWVYCAVTGSFNTVWVPWVTVVESLVQVTVVAGPPVEIQVRVN